MSRGPLPRAVVHFPAVEGLSGLGKSRPICQKAFAPGWPQSVDEGTVPGAFTGPRSWTD